jgi:alkylated DNA repair dioxygenase AlkB
MLIEDAIPDGVATKLFESLRDQIEWDTQIRARMTASFGEPYVGSGISYARKPMHPLLSSLIVECATLARFEPTNCLLNYYPTGTSGMGFHSDATDNLATGTGIAIFSFGSARTILFRRKAAKTERFEIGLTNGSLLIMSAESQTEWDHSIPATEDPGGRISATFRRIVA